MDPCEETFNVCLRYLVDAQQELPEEVYNVLRGYHRARRHDLLSSCTRLLPQQSSFGAGSFKVLRQVEALFKKNSAFASDETCTVAAERNFHRAERRNRITNRRLDYYYVRRDRLNPDLDFWLSKMEAFVAKVLGPFESFVDALPRLIRLTGGATSTHPRADSLPYMKIGVRVSATSGAVPYLRALYRYYKVPGPKVRIVTTNRVVLVPKSWKTHRTIGCEPTGNLPLQLAVDSYVKDRLRVFGIDLRQQDRNQRLALEGSLTDKVATIDLEQASDTCSYNTIAWLFPQSWFEYLHNVRTPDFTGCFGDGTYAKFSSMGNGATFCLETLVFAAAAHAIRSKTVSVYGDDIIVDSDKVDDLKRLLGFLGFSVNTDKSFSSGPFRESCGKDYYRGIDITPFYLRGIGQNKPDRCHVINGLVSIGKRHGSLWDLCQGLVRDWKLPLVAYNGVSTSGVWTTPDGAYTRKLLRWDKCPKRLSTNWYQTPKQKVWVAVCKSKTLQSRRTLFLWHLRANYGSNDLQNALEPDRFRFAKAGLMSLFEVRKLYFVNEPDPRCSSRVPTGYKYKSQWELWVIPRTGVPSHLYWWEEQLNFA